jgi:hypothetical protein
MEYGTRVFMKNFIIVIFNFVFGKLICTYSESNTTTTTTRTTTTITTVSLLIYSSCFCCHNHRIFYYSCIKNSVSCCMVFALWTMDSNIMLSRYVILLLLSSLLLLLSPWRKALWDLFSAFTAVITAISQYRALRNLRWNNSQYVFVMV